MNQLFHGKEQYWLDRYYKVAYEKDHFMEALHLNELKSAHELNVFSSVEGGFIITVQDLTVRVKTHKGIREFFCCKF
ncbi:MAG: hypothetical protein ACI8QD_002450 [Cyclobacteriaceae bacterium]